MLDAETEPKPVYLKGKVHNISPQNCKPCKAYFTRIDCVMNLICHLGLVLFLRRTVAS
jgi:hypothetical protein